VNRGRRTVVTASAAVLLGIGLAGTAVFACASYLLFEHIGPEDASGPPFTVAVGDVGASSYRTILVDQVTYTAIRDTVRASYDEPERTPRPPGTFEVTAFDCGTPQATYRIYPEAMLSIIALVDRMARGVNESLPTTFVTLRTLLSR
jgi:hypothetical protein